jgi:cytoskeletal protein CcmA (bactofilin family)
MAKTNIPETPSINLIGAGTTVKGDIKSTGDFRIDGMLLGSINSQGKVIVGTTGKLDGEIICQNADISGEVKARVMVTELLTLKASAKLAGDITINKLAIEPGAKFSGTCTMHDAEFKPTFASAEDEKSKAKKEIA